MTAEPIITIHLFQKVYKFTHDTNDIQKNTKSSKNNGS